MKYQIFVLCAAALLACSCSAKPRETSRQLAAPADLTVETLTETSARLQWSSESEGVTGWWVYRRGENDPFHVTPLNADEPLPASARSYDFDGLQPGASYSFGVQALAGNAAENSTVTYAPLYTYTPPTPPSADPSESPVEVTPVSVTVNEKARTVRFQGTSRSGERLVLSLGPVSANKTVQIDEYTIGNESFRSYTDWIGPWHMRTVAPTGQTEKAWGFTGGWHGSNGDGTGDPTASTRSFAVSIDDTPCPDGTVSGNRAVCTVVNQVEAANTKFGDDKRFVLEEQVTYTYEDGLLHVRVEAQALEDVRIAIYYGMQIAGGFCTRFTFRTEDGTEQTATDSFLMPGRVREMTGWSAGGHSVTAALDDEGLGTFSRATRAYSALVQYYGENNGKGYYMLIGDKEGGSSALVLKKGETIFWSGYYEFR